MGALRAIFKGDRQADRVVPPSGFTAQLTLFAAGAMAFLAFASRKVCRRLSHEVIACERV